MYIYGVHGIQNVNVEDNSTWLYIISKVKAVYNSVGELWGVIGNRPLSLTDFSWRREMWLILGLKTCFTKVFWFIQFP